MRGASMGHRYLGRYYRAQISIILISSLLLLQMLIRNATPAENIAQYPARTTSDYDDESINLVNNNHDEEIELNLGEINDDIDEADEDENTISGSLLKSIKSVKQKIRENNIPTISSNIDIKPLVNLTINALGLFDDVNPEEPFDPKDSKRILHSMFQIWNPQASKWATKASREFKNKMRRGLESGDESSVRTSSVKEKLVRIDECGCDRTIQVEETRLWNLTDSTCSSASYMRGAGQKIISFSFYGNPNSTKGKERKYFQGIKENLSLVPLHYPGWIIRVYYDLEQSDSVLTSLCDLACSNPNIDICHVRNNPASGDISKIFAMNWRFFPALDPQVDAMVSRDLDSRINSREAAAVEEWTGTKSHFHFMRDNPAHGIEILGSGWGVRMGPQGSVVRDMFKRAFREAAKDAMFWADRGAYGPDQGFLKRYIWPWAKWSAISHDAYFCRQFPRTSPFPTRRKNDTNNFVAAIVEAGDYLVKECPEVCRPKEHPDWTTC